MTDARLRVLIVSQYYLPENVPIPSEIAEALAARGHDVRVITGFPNYPHGKVFDGYRQRWRSRAKAENVDVLRVPIYPDHSNRALHRVANYLSFALSSATALRFSRGADVVYVYATQLTAAMGPWIWRRGGGAPYVLHVQDLWPDSITGSSLALGGRSSIIARALNPWIRSVQRSAAAVLGIAPTMVQTLQDRGVSEVRSHLVYNWALDPRRAGDAGSPRTAGPHPGTAVRAIYAGNLGDLQDLETVVRATARMPAEQFHLTIVGDGIAGDRIRSLARDLGADNIDFRGSVPRDEMTTLYAAAHYGLVTLKDRPMFRGTIPSKLQALLAHSLPVITTVAGDVQRIIEERAIGVFAAPEDVDALEAALWAARRFTALEWSEMATRARETYESEFSHDAGISKIEAVLAEVVDVAQRTEGRVRRGSDG